MIRADQQAHQVRYHQADETDQARCRNRGTDAQGGAQHQLQFDPFDIEAQVTRLRFTQQQRVECSGAARQPQGNRHGHDQ
ncbi:hypothetical protein D3C76_1798960 [compost metagenome]